jgi:D-tyrosyl-tRNA(Tyr) deacylase
VIALVQRVSAASVAVGGRVVGEIGAGILALVCAERGDDESSADRLVERILSFRMFPDAAGKMNFSVRDSGGGLLLVSQFTLAADTRGGNRRASLRGRPRPGARTLRSRGGAGPCAASGGCDRRVRRTDAGGTRERRAGDILAAGRSSRGTVLSEATGRLRMGVGGRIAGMLLRLIGWRAVFVPPARPRSVIIVYPHTSAGTSSSAFSGGRRSGHTFAAKDTLFRGPFGAWLQRVGGIPVNRREATGLVGQLTGEFARRPEFHLVFTPEGTRARSDCWKTGFYRLARAAQVPLGLAFIDYGRREVGVGAWLDLTGDQETDLDRIRAFYAGKRGRRNELAGPIRFPAREEPH